MATQQHPHHRRSIRLRNYDYSQAGAYFITICVQGKRCLLGEVSGTQSVPSNAGIMVEQWWFELARKFPSIVLDEYVIMPNHFHGILIIDHTPGPMPTPELRAKGCRHSRGLGLRGAYRCAGAPSLGHIVDWFKTMSTNGYIRGVKNSGWPRFHGKFWQRNYYEHIIRDEKDLDQKRRYVLDNPRRWGVDEENPTNTAKENP